MAGGGGDGKAAGIVHIIMTGAGFIIAMSQLSILMWTQAGGDTTETETGTVTDGTMNGFHTGSLNGTGRAGEKTDIGKGKGPGASRAIGSARNKKDGN